MKTGIDLAQDILSLVDVDEITSIITGNVYLFERPQNSVLQDIVIGTLVLTNDQMQQGLGNVNCHCPNLKGVTINGAVDATLPDVVALNLISGRVTNLLNNYHGKTFFLSAQNTGVPLRDDINGTWYVNIRVNYNSFQDNYTNI